MKNPLAAQLLTAALLIVLTSTGTAQKESTSQVVITVIDQTGAAIPGAHIGIIGLPSDVPSGGDWLRYALRASEQASAQTDATGEATVGLANGSYAIAIAAAGFQRHVERIEVADERSEALQATLLVAATYSPYVIISSEPEIALEHAYLDRFIPLEPLQTIALSSTRVRRRWIRF